MDNTNNKISEDITEKEDMIEKEDESGYAIPDFIMSFSLASALALFIVSGDMYEFVGLIFTPKSLIFNIAVALLVVLFVILSIVTIVQIYRHERYGR